MGRRKGRYEVTPIGKIVLVLVLIAAFAGLIFGGVKLGLIKPSSGKKDSQKIETTAAKAGGNEKTEVPKETMSASVSKKDDNSSTPASSSSDTINLSLDEWIGWKSIIDANGGLETQPGSIYDQLGIKVNISVINDATQSSNALIKGDLNGAGYTINRTAFLSKKFTDAGVDIIMPFITNYSNGGDGIIATNDFQDIDSLVNAKIGIPEFSEAQTLVMWFLDKSDLTDEQKQTIIDNFVYFETPDEVAKAFFAGHVDVAATWEPYLTQAKGTSNCHVMFSTATSRNLVMDGITFRRDFAEANPELISKFIDGALQASDMYMTDFDAIREVMPMFSGCTDDEIIESAVNADLTTWNDNMTLLTDNAKSIYFDMCSIWGSIGEQVNANMVDTLFDTTYVAALSDKYESVKDTKGDTASRKTVVKVTEDNKDEIINAPALLEKKVTINFEAQTCLFMNNAEATEQLEEFVDIAKSLDGAIIQIEGNVAASSTNDDNKKLSLDRADTVKKFFVMQGIDGNRIVTVGNGADKPVANNYNADGSLSKEGTDANRRTDIYFKSVELVAD